ncbi:MAG: hypothetical protein JST31_07815 [Actinobacteria bacterium]|nr:hypothetical protein [Actinomycetota bacterium]
MKVTWHMFVHPVHQAAYTDRIASYVSSIAGPDVEFEFLGLDPPDSEVHRVSELRTGAQVVANLIEAERRGADVCVMGHFQDPCLWEARGALDIPVLGLGETSMLFACMYGRRVGVVTISPKFIHWHEEQIHRYHLDERITGVAAMETSVEHYVAALDDRAAYEAIRAQFIDAGRGLVAAGAEVLIPAGGLPALLFREERDWKVDGAAVLNPVPLVAKQAEVAGSLRALNGFTTSRHSSFELATESARDELVEHFGGHAAPVRPADGDRG